LSENILVYTCLWKTPFRCCKTVILQWRISHQVYHITNDTLTIVTLLLIMKIGDMAIQEENLLILLIMKMWKTQSLSYRIMLRVTLYYFQAEFQDTRDLISSCCLLVPL
jgi:hypothetical protein